MSFRVTLGAALFAFATALTGCGGDDKGDDDDNDDKTDSDTLTPHDPPAGIDTPERSHTAAGSSWTFLVYMVADNDLEPFALGDLEEMMQVGSGANFNIVVEVDRADGYTTDNVGGISNWTSTKRFQVEDGTLTEIADLGETNMGQSSALADFITWGIQTYPADKIALILWDHGSAWPGFGADFASNYDGLTLSEQANALQTALTAVGRESIALIGYDACLMGSLETALALRPYAEYLLASEELEPGHGWDYNALATINGTSSAPDLAEALVDGFHAQATTQGTVNSITLSLVDLYNLKAVERALVAMDNALVAQGSLVPQVVRARGDALEFGYDPTGSASANMVDLGNVADALKSISAFASSANALNTALTAAVLHQTTGRATAAATGLSVYWPPNRRAFNDDYNAVPHGEAWRNFLESAQGVEHQGSEIVPQFTSDEADATPGSDGYLTFSAELVSGTEVNVVTEGMYYGLQLLTGDTVSNYVLGDYFGGIDGQTVASAWDGTVLYASQGDEGDFVYYSLQLGDEGTYISSVPFIYVSPTTPEDGTLAMYVLVQDSESTLQENFYLISDAGYGELTPEENSYLYPYYARLNDDGVMEYIASSAALDATQPISLEPVQLPTDREDVAAFIILYAQDSLGNTAAASWVGDF